jgi:hypothetical protein
LALKQKFLGFFLPECPHHLFPHGRFPDALLGFLRHFFQLVKKEKTEEITTEGTPQREILSPVEASLDHLWTTLFHRLLQMDKG